MPQWETPFSPQMHHLPRDLRSQDELMSVRTRAKATIETSNTSKPVSGPLQQMNVVGLEFVELRQRLGHGLEPSAEVEADGI